jgi:GMP synthase-like glutamine amidotransferase
MSSRGLLLQHGHDGPAVQLEDWLRERAIPYDVHHAWEEPPPPLRGRAFVASLGSERSAAGDGPPWVRAEIEALREAVEADVPVLGLCFGGQALSVVLGGAVERAPEPEIGWLPVDTRDPSVAEGPWAHYHYEVLQVPPGAEELARTAAGPAAFRAGPHLGVQFHPETTAELMSKWVRMDPNLPSSVIPDQVDEQGRRYGAAAREQAFRLFDAWWTGARGRE